MKIERKIDELGRLVIPLETRQKLGIKEGDTLAIDIDDKKIILEKVEK